MEQGMMSQFFSLVQFGFRLEPNGKESTLVQLEFLYQPKNIVARLMYALMMRRKLDELRQTLLGNLKTLIEQREVRLKS
ncbi:MAG: hypothetical protein HYZ73_04120 [Elusimicrobia bacterium]|nr:hypothetical protein [Elusimicrobiota bacterium]